MNIKQLKELIKDLPDDTPIVCSHGVGSSRFANLVEFEVIESCIHNKLIVTVDATSSGKTYNVLDVLILGERAEEKEIEKLKPIRFLTPDFSGPEP